MVLTNHPLAGAGNHPLVSPLGSSAINAR